MRQLKRLRLPLLLLTSMLVGTLTAGEGSDPAGSTITVYKTPTCGCCSKWVSHLQDNGFEVETIDMNDLRMIKSMSGVAPKYSSCHTAKVGGYVIEGHVPADDIRRLLVEKPDIRGLAVPGMPMGSPGMEGPRKDNYSVLAIGRDNDTSVYATH